MLYGGAFALDEERASSHPTQLTCISIASIPPLVRPHQLAPLEKSETLGGKGKKGTEYGEVTPTPSLNIFPGLSVLESSLPYCPTAYLQGLLPSNSPSEKQEKQAPGT